MSGKQTKEQTPKTSTRRRRKPFEFIHTKLCKPLPTLSLKGSKYFPTFINDYNRFTWIYFFRKKIESLKNFKEFKKLAKNQTRRRVKVLRSNWGGEYTSSAFINFCKDHGMNRELTQAHTPHQNGILEQKNQTLLEKAWSIYLLSQLPHYL
jgi:transposase InsO family protein